MSALAPILILAAAIILLPIVVLRIRARRSPPAIHARLIRNTKAFLTAQGGQEPPGMAPSQVDFAIKFGQARLFVKCLSASVELRERPMRTLIDLSRKNAAAVFKQTKCASLFVVDFQISAEDAAFALAENVNVIAFDRLSEIVDVLKPDGGHHDRLTPHQTLLATQLPAICFKLSEIYRAQEDFANAIIWGQRAADAQMNHPFWHIHLSRLHVAVRDYTAAETILDQGLLIDPNSPNIQDARITLNLARGDRPTALAIAEQAILTFPDLPTFQERWARLSEQITKPNIKTK